MTAPTQRPASTSDAAKRKAETEGRCWRGECRTGCYYPDVCSERAPAPAEPDAAERADLTAQERADLRYEAGIILADGPEYDDGGIPSAEYVVADGLVRALDLLDSRTPGARLAAAKADRGPGALLEHETQKLRISEAYWKGREDGAVKALEEAADAWETDDADPTPRTGAHADGWLRARAARLREQGGE